MQKPNNLKNRNTRITIQKSRTNCQQVNCLYQDKKNNLIMIHMKRQLACLLSVRYFLAQNKMVKVIQRRKFYFINVSIDLRDRIIRKKLKGMVSRYFRGLQTILMDKAFYIFVYNFKFKVSIKIIISH